MLICILFKLLFGLAVVVSFRHYSDFHRKVALPVVLSSTSRHNAALLLQMKAKQDDVFDAVGRSKMIAMFPLEILQLDQISSLRKSFVGGPYATVLSGSRVLTSVNMSPFCMLAEHLTSQQFCVFVDNMVDQNFEAMCAWMRKYEDEKRNPIDVDGNRYPLVLCKKGHLVVLSSDRDAKHTPTKRTPIRSARIKVAGDRFIVPGDYVVNEKYGVGVYVGTTPIIINPADQRKKVVTGIVVRYMDGEVTWFEKFVSQELWVFRTAESGEQELGSILDLRKWNRRKKSVESRSKSTAMNLINLMAIRDNLHRTPCISDNEEYKAFEEAFPYEPTVDQYACFEAITQDMVYNTRPMDRLVCGDVGFGKTEVAMRAIYRAVLSRKQVAFLAPTRVLAKQHERTLKARMPELNIQLLRGGGRGNAAQVKEDVRNGVCQVVIGTHALLQPSVDFDNLGLLVVDEEQRFGVTHKEKLKSTASGTDVLTLSATPIPRTLQFSLSGLRDFSMIQSPPSGRKEIVVYVGAEGGSVESTNLLSVLDGDGESEDEAVVEVSQTKNYKKKRHDESSDRSRSRSGNSAISSSVSPYSSDVTSAELLVEVAPRAQEEDTWVDVAGNGGLGEIRHGAVLRRAILRELLRDGQVFVVVPFVKDVHHTAERLQGLIPNLRIVQAHGQHTDLEDRIDTFLQKEADVLIATTVIENGIDMPNVNTIIVLTADRFGISTLYQLKGRVGRGQRQAYAYFLTSNGSITVEAEQRLTYLKTFTALGSGYDLSLRDMEMRGHGSLFGSEQSGARDVGLDLQAKIMAKALDEIKQDLILPVPETRVDIDDELQQFGIHELGPLPSYIAVDEEETSRYNSAGGGINALSRWEMNLVESVIQNIVRTIHPAESNSGAQDFRRKQEFKKASSDAVTDQKAVTAGNRRAGKEKKKEKRDGAKSLMEQAGHDARVRVLVRSLISANSAQEVQGVCSELLQLLSNGNSHASMLVHQLEQRCRLRTAARKLGFVELRAVHVHSTTRVDADSRKQNERPSQVSYVMRAPELTPQKWGKLIKLISPDDAKSLLYKARISDERGGGGGAIRFSSPRQQLSSNEVYQELIRLLESCATHVDEMLQATVGSKQDVEENR